MQVKLTFDTCAHLQQIKAPNITVSEQKRPKTFFFFVTWSLRLLGFACTNQTQFVQRISSDLQHSQCLPSCLPFWYFFFNKRDSLTFIPHSFDTSTCGRKDVFKKREKKTKFERLGNVKWDICHKFPRPSLFIKCNKSQIIADNIKWRKNSKIHKQTIFNRQTRGNTVKNEDAADGLRWWLLYTDFTM